MNTRVPLSEGLPTSFTIAQARAAGVGYGRTRGSDLVTPFHGVRAAVPPDEVLKPEAEVRRKAAQYAPRLRTGQFFCEATAVALHGLPLSYREANGPLHVGVILPRIAPRTKGVVGHHYSVGPLLVSSSACSPLDAWVQCAARLPLDDLVMIGDALVCRDAPLATRAQLEAAVARAAGRRGSRLLAEAFALVRERTDSPRETVVRLLIVRAGLPEPGVNSPVRDGRGRKLGSGDLVYERWKVVIEYEGEYHFATEEQIQFDIDRLASFAAAGWTVVRVHKRHLADPAALVRRIRAALVANGWAEK